LGAPSASVRERYAKGKALRSRLARGAQGAWKPIDRGDLVDRLVASVAGRRRDLLPIRWKRMAASPFGFFRGAAAIMAADLGALRTAGLEVQVCGDAHLLNLGAYAAPDGHLVFDLNDFDETCRGPFEWDLKRLAASLVVGGRDAGNGDPACTEAVRSMVRSYREGLDRFSRMQVLELARLEITPRRTGRSASPVFARAARDTPQKLVEKVTLPAGGGFARFRSRPPLLRRLKEGQARSVLAGLEAYRTTLGPARRQVIDRYAPRDFAFKVVGTGSVGVDDYLVLLYGNGPEDPLFLQVKEEDASCWTPYLRRARARPADDAHGGRRVAEGQLRAQTVSDPFLGWTRVGRKNFLVRQWSDHKASIGVDLLSGRALGDLAVLCGEVLAKAHSRTGDAAMLAGYCGSSESLDETLAVFAVAYADRTGADHGALRRAIRSGSLTRAS
jgi:uncharacterized protein (DUF2252 family)